MAPVSSAAVYFGATRMVECRGDDVPDGQRMIFGGFAPILDV
jgi:uncharacterized protein YbaA (DUF1428 family)